MSNESERKRHPKAKFSLEEDLLLNRLVFQFGPGDWNVISHFVSGRNARQCRERWLKYLCPVNRFEPFRPEEDALLRKLYQQFGAKWVKISRYFPRRTDINVKNRWLVLMRHDQKERQSADDLGDSPVDIEDNFGMRPGCGEIEGVGWKNGEFRGRSDVWEDLVPHWDPMKLELPQEFGDWH
jgi:hypothetical protein